VRLEEYERGTFHVAREDVVEAGGVERILPSVPVRTTSSTAWCTGSRLLDGDTTGRGPEAGREELQAEISRQDCHMLNTIPVSRVHPSPETEHCKYD